MTRYEKIKQELTIEKVAEYMELYDDSYCTKICEEKTGDRYECPYKPIYSDQCHKCAIEYLNMEVEE